MVPYRVFCVVLLGTARPRLVTPRATAKLKVVVGAFFLRRRGVLYVKQVIVKAPADGAEILNPSRPPLPAKHPLLLPEYALAHKMTESSSVNGMFELEAMEYERETKIFMRGRREIKLRVIYSGPAEQTLNQGRLLIVRCGVSLAAGGGVLGSA